MVVKKSNENEVFEDSKIVVEQSQDGLSVDIEVINPDIHIAYVDALMELYPNYKDKMRIILKINDIAIVFYRHKKSGEDIFKVFGREYTAGSNLQLITPVYLGEKSIKTWRFYPYFFKYMFPELGYWRYRILTHK